jgi:ABC-type antimicrobial peptide transport system permease subunit
VNITPRVIKNVLRNPFRLVLVVLLLGVSLMFVATMVSLNNSAQDELDAVHKQVGTDITINYATNQAGGSSASSGGTTGSTASVPPPITPIPNSVVSRIAKIPGIASIEETLQETDTTSVLKTNPFQAPNGQSFSFPPTMDGFSPEATHFTIGGNIPIMTAGRMFQNGDAHANDAVISQSMASNNNFKVGSTFKLKNTTMTVIGIYKSTGSQVADDTIIVPMATLQRLYSTSGVDSITAYATSYDQVSTVASKLRTTLGSKFDVTTQDSLYASTFNAINVARNSIQLALIVSLITAAVVIVFAVLLLVRERTLEIGTLKAIGASHWQVIRQFWSEVLTLSLLSSVLAIVLLAVLGPVISQMFDIAPATQDAGGGGNGASFSLGAGSGSPSQLSNIHLANAGLNLQTLLIILGLGIALAIVTSIIPTLYVTGMKPAIVLRKGN